MAEGHRMTGADLVDKLMSDEHADVLRDSVAWLVTQLMEAELGELAGAGFGERAPDRRQTQRNGYRPRRWDTRVGELQLASPAAMPEGPPGVARAFGCEARRAGPCVAELAGAPQGAQRASVAPLRVALGSGCTRRGPELPPGAARSGIARGPVPSRPVIPGLAHPQAGRAGPWLVPWAWSGQTPRGTGPQKYPALVAAPLVTTGRSPREVPSIGKATVGGGAARSQAAIAWRPRWTAVRRRPYDLRHGQGDLREQGRCGPQVLGGPLRPLRHSDRRQLSWRLPLAHHLGGESRMVRKGGSPPTVTTQGDVDV
jgi:hypothetical protein